VFAQDEESSSALMAGAGIRGGAVYGASDKHGAFVANRPVSPEDFGATVFHALGDGQFAAASETRGTWPCSSPLPRPALPLTPLPGGLKNRGYSHPSGPIAHEVNRLVNRPFACVKGRKWISALVRL